VDSSDVAMVNGPAIARVLGDQADRKVNLNEPTRIGGDPGVH
jgi:hypothetical protein